MRRIYTFVDNSNIFIEGQKAAATRSNDPEIGKRYRLDFGKLFAYINAGRGEIYFKSDSYGAFPKLYGSEPPKLDTLWKILKDLGVETKVFQRNIRNKEKRVDSALIRDFGKLLYKQKIDQNGLIIIAGGDADYFDLVTDAEEEGITIEIHCWETATARIIKNLPNFKNLSYALDKVGFYEKEKVDHYYGEINWDEYMKSQNGRGMGRITPRRR